MDLSSDCSIKSCDTVSWWKERLTCTNYTKGSLTEQVHRQLEL